jgi:hypothetical protein
MRDFQAWKKKTIRYWERRRLAYNLLLIPPAFFGWGLVGSVSAAGGDQEHLTTVDVLALFFFCAIAANVCYSLVYVLEFIFGSEDPQQRWNAHGRNAIFIAGVLLSILLALMGGRNIAIAQYSGLRLF